jgi:hypothetical protein
MAFGQASGPPATAKQLGELLELLHQAGHADFRDARGPLGFNQRQAAGKFTRDEADAFIERLSEEAEGGPPPEPERPAAAPPEPSPRLTKPSTPRRSSVDEAVRKIPTTVLAAELQRRGWVVLEP